MPEVIMQPSAESSYPGDAETSSGQLPEEPRVVAPDFGWVGEPPFGVEHKAGDCLLQLVWVADAPVTLGASGFDWPVVDHSIIAVIVVGDAFTLLALAIVTTAWWIFRETQHRLERKHAGVAPVIHVPRALAGEHGYRSV
jgi:hypothetical protein